MPFLRKEKAGISPGDFRLSLIHICIAIYGMLVSILIMLRL